MPRLPIVNARELIRALERGGCRAVGQTGSHLRLRRGNARVTVPVHGARDIRKGTLRTILRYAGMTVQELLDLL